VAATRSSAVATPVFNSWMLRMLRTPLSHPID
jgi:hypothetical protein